MTGKMPDEGINPVELPDVLFDLWQWFIKLSSSRIPSMGVSPITHQEMLSFCHLYGIRMESWEIDAIRMLDSIALDSANSKG